MGDVLVVHCCARRVDSSNDMMLKRADMFGAFFRGVERAVETFRTQVAAHVSSGVSLCAHRLRTGAMVSNCPCLLLRHVPCSRVVAMGV